MRLQWDDYFLGVATSVALRGDCTRSQVGAVLVNPDHRIVSTGYNGVSPGAPGCLEGACPRGRMTYEEFPSDPKDYSNCVAFHAERNALMFTPVLDRPGTTLYVTRVPCVACKLLLLSEHVARVVWYDSFQRRCSEPLVE